MFFPTVICRQSALVTKISWRRPQSSSSRRQHFLAPAAADVCHQVVAPPTLPSNTNQPTPDVTRSPLSLSLSLSLSDPQAPSQLPCPWPSAFVRAVIGLYGAAFMGTSTPLACLLPPCLACQLNSCSFEICNNQPPEKVSRTPFTRQREIFP